VPHKTQKAAGDGAPTARSALPAASTAGSALATYHGNEIAMRVHNPHLADHQEVHIWGAHVIYGMDYAEFEALRALAKARKAAAK